MRQHGKSSLRLIFRPGEHRSKEAGVTEKHGGKASGQAWGKASKKAARAWERDPNHIFCSVGKMQDKSGGFAEGSLME